MMGHEWEWTLEGDGNVTSGGGHTGGDTPQNQSILHFKCVHQIPWLFLRVYAKTLLSFVI